MDLMDLAFESRRRIGQDGKILNNYAPISLPYYHITEDGRDGEGEGAKKGRPEALHVDEANANAAKMLFLDEDDALQEDNIMLMQLPAVLPELVDALDEVQRETEDAATTGAGASITRMPDGRVGKMQILRSGRVRLEIGGLPFCVDQGCDTFFQQDLACVCPLSNELIVLGPVSKRVVLTPDVDALLAMSPSGAEAADVDSQGARAGAAAALAT